MWLLQWLVGCSGCQGVVMWLLMCSESILTHCYAVSGVFLVVRVLSYICLGVLSRFEHISMLFLGHFWFPGCCYTFAMSI